MLDTNVYTQAIGVAARRARAFNNAAASRRACIHWCFEPQLDMAREWLAHD